MHLIHILTVAMFVLYLEKKGCLASVATTIEKTDPSFLKVHSLGC